MASAYYCKWNKYPSEITSEEDKKKYREQLLLPCVNCKRTLALNIWNRDFTAIVEDGGSAEYDFQPIYCPKCGATVNLNAKVEPPQSDTR